MRTIKFVVPGEPVPQPRPRFAMVRGKVHVYNPPRAKAWKRLVGLMLKTDGRWNKKPITGPVSISVSFVFSGKPYEPHTKRPDIDNLLKSLMDALTDAGLWHDDKLVVKVSADKAYRQVAESVVLIEEWE